LRYQSIHPSIEIHLNSATCRKRVKGGCSTFYCNFYVMLYAVNDLWLFWFSEYCNNKKVGLYFWTAVKSPFGPFGIFILVKNIVCAIWFLRPATIGGWESVRHLSSLCLDTQSTMSCDSWQLGKLFTAADIKELQNTIIKTYWLLKDVRDFFSKLHQSILFISLMLLFYNRILCFYARKQLLLSARLSHRNSVRPSVCLSHGWISQRRCKLESPNLHHRLPGRL